MGRRIVDPWEKSSVFRSTFRNEYQNGCQSQLKSACRNSDEFLRRLGILNKIRVHDGCVNSVHWNSTGEYVLSGSDDQYIAISNPFTKSLLLRYKTAHNLNIFSCRFMPFGDDHAVVSCSGDGVILHTEFLAPYAKTKRPIVPNEYDINENYFNCHRVGIAYDVLTIPDEPRCFLSCGEDGTVRLFDLRVMSRCNERLCARNVYVKSPSAVNAMDLAPINRNMLAIGCADSIVRIYDRRQLSVINSRELKEKTYETTSLKAYPIPTPDGRVYRTTCVKYSPDERELLVSYSSDYLYLFNLKHEGYDSKKLVATGRYLAEMQRFGNSNNPTPRLRLRGDWSDTGPNARPTSEIREGTDLGQVRPPLQANVMGRIAGVITRMLNESNIRADADTLNYVGTVAAVVEAVSITSAPLERHRNGLLRRPFDNDRNSSEAAESMGTTSASTSAAAAATSTGALSPTQASNNNNLQELPTTTSHWRRAILRTIEHLTPSTQSIPVMQQPPFTRKEETNGNASGSAQSSSSNMMAMGPSSNHLNSAIVVMDEPYNDIANLQGHVLKKFTGHRNSRTMIKTACFWGDGYIMSGSDCGHIFVWEKKTGKLVKLMEADRHVVNRVNPHPYMPYLISSGIDYDIKMWAPIDADYKFNTEFADELMQRNAVMLAETMDTITVPAPMLIRLLSSIHSLRNRNHSRRINAIAAAENAFNTDNEHPGSRGNNDDPENPTSHSSSSS